MLRPPCITCGEHRRDESYMPSCFKGVCKKEVEALEILVGAVATLRDRHKRRCECKICSAYKNLMTIREGWPASLMK